LDYRYFCPTVKLDISVQEINGRSQYCPKLRQMYKENVILHHKTFYFCKTCGKLKFLTAEKRFKNIFWAISPVVFAHPNICDCIKKTECRDLINQARWCGETINNAKQRLHNGFHFKQSHCKSYIPTSSANP
jgi:hypothetical protein